MAPGLGADAVFRANPDYALVLAERLGADQQASLLAGDASDDLYGALVPRGGGARDWLAVSCDTALLFTALAQPGPLPRYALRRLGGELDAALMRLLLDGVLQVSIDGRFTCGPQAAALFAASPVAAHARTDELSLAALRYGETLACLPEQELGQRLYCYGRKPVSPQLQARFPDGTALLDFLGIAEDGPLVRSLHPRWHAVRAAPGVHAYWRQWLSTTARARPNAQRAAYKLYLSPVLDDAPAALAALIAALPQAQGVTGFKVGSGLAGLCRPDKIVVYFTQLDDLYGFAERLRIRLAGCAAHGVPFSAAASADGLLSWGADPPRAAGGNARSTSWRMWVSLRLADYLVAAGRAGPAAPPPHAYALERLRLAGIDTGTWIPADGMWPAALETA